MNSEIIRQKWWKVIGVVLMLYVLIAGLLIPLRPGIESIDTRMAEAGEHVELEVVGYNTRWKSPGEDKIRIWLKYNDSMSIQAYSVTARDDRHLKAAFNMPNSSPSPSGLNMLSLIVDHPSDETSILPAALVLNVTDPAPAGGEWKHNQISGLHFESRFAFPYRNILAETIRNQNFHVPLWFSMFILFLFSVIKSILNLKEYTSRRDHHIAALNATGILLGILGLLTGMIWAQHTWGTFWNWDIKQTMALIAMLIYLAYFVLRASIDDRLIRARVSNVYNIFAFAMLFPLLFVVPRLVVSLHPGSGGNPAFGGDDLDDTLKMVFYPAVLAWTLLAFWIASLVARFQIVREKHKMTGK